MDIEKLAKEHGAINNTPKFKIGSCRSHLGFGCPCQEPRFEFTTFQLEEFAEAYHQAKCNEELQTQHDKVESAEVLVEALCKFTDDAILVDIGGGDFVGTSCESLEIANEALATYYKLSEVKHGTK